MSSPSASSTAKMRPTMSSAPRTPSPKPRDSPHLPVCDSSTTSLLDRPSVETDSLEILGEIWDPFDCYSQLLIEPSLFNSPPPSTRGSTADSLRARYDRFLQAFRKLPPVSKPRLLTQENPRRRSFWRRNKVRDHEPNLNSVDEKQVKGQDENLEVYDDDLDDGWIETDLADEVWTLCSNDSTDTTDKAEVKEEESNQQTKGRCANPGQYCGVEHQKRWHPRVHPLFAARYGDDPNWCVPGHVSC
ncbi:hypothetical protein F5Y06DRAFT_282449 [Hypoxylon sp. FL0890]|nr:hypothetical protein F5Y06DRAFT_282449 [Hypoxylon sp. FL0890]